MSLLDSLPAFWIVVLTAMALFIGEGFILGFLRAIGFYTVVNEREARVYVLFGNVLGVLQEPGLHLLWFKLGPGAFLVNILGQCHVRFLGLDQEYIRSIPVNSEEGAPMGIGIWYERVVSDPVAHIFQNADPAGSLRANVNNAAVRCLSNMKLAEMLENRHVMSRTVRTEVSPDSKVWGFQVGSVYIRKVHFRDMGMLQQIEQKVVNRLRQVTSAIKQDGQNQVNIISSTAEKEAAAEFARAQAMRSEIVGAELQRVARDREVGETLFEILETQQILDGQGSVVLIPPRSRNDLLTQLAVAPTSPPPPGKQ